jgi:soluble lytic murein transglycosylase-like protein
LKLVDLYCFKPTAAAGETGNAAENQKVIHFMISKLFAAFLAVAAALTFSAPAFSSPYDTIISKYARSYGVPVSLAKAVVQIESSYRPNLRGKAGEIGLMQVKLSTARGMGYTGSAKGLYNPDTNIRYGMKYLAMAHKIGGRTTCGTILRYNAGHGATRMNPVSARYCSKVKQVMGVSA